MANLTTCYHDIMRIASICIETGCHMNGLTFALEENHFYRDVSNMHRKSKHTDAIQFP